MAPSQHRLVMIAVCLVASGVVPGVLAQPTQEGPMYDTKAEARFKGTVEAVEKVAGPGRGGRVGLGGTHLTLKTDTETIAVHLGPTAFLMEKKIDLVKGDAVEILGSRVKIDDEQVLLAREVKKGDNTWTLRDASGRPLWSGGRR